MGESRSSKSGFLLLFGKEHRGNAQWTSLSVWSWQWPKILVLLLELLLLLLHHLRIKSRVPSVVAPACSLSCRRMRISSISRFSWSTSSLPKPGGGVWRKDEMHASNFVNSCASSSSKGVPPPILDEIARVLASDSWKTRKQPLRSSMPVSGLLFSSALAQHPGRL